MAKIIMAIRPMFVDKIIAGEKRYEYRTKVPNRVVENVLIYCTSPVKQVVGEFSVKSILSDTPDRLWERTCDFSGLDNSMFFDTYFGDRALAYAYEIDKVIIYDEPRNLDYYGLRSAPQSFVYLD